ncbi:hypothetical protein ABT034_34890 [Streptomyces sp. NPDC002773]|uniref:hypothetical protein n=1 Tax=Streptomyces sp. NPDC002773 TaxID=3154430 RepID=UPI0033327F75
MIKNFARGFAALSLALTPLAVPASAHATPAAPAASVAAVAQTFPHSLPAIKRSL